MERIHFSLNLWADKFQRSWEIWIVYIDASCYALTQPKWMDSVFQMLNFWCKDADNIIIIITLLLIPITFMQTQKIHCMFVRICI